jgi:hypothetical protein
VSIRRSLRIEFVGIFNGLWSQTELNFRIEFNLLEGLCFIISIDASYHVLIIYFLCLYGTVYKQPP